MKRAVILVTGTLLMFLVACNSGGGTGVDGPVRLDESYADALPVSTQLALGSLQLEESELAIDEALAAELLPLWQAYLSLSNSDTVADAELDALLNQIQDSMTTEQVEAIAAMELTMEAATSALQEFGPGLGGRFRGGLAAEQAGENSDQDFPPGGSSIVLGVPPPAGGASSGGGPPSGGFVLGGGVPGAGPGRSGQPGVGRQATRLAEQFGGDLSEEDIAMLFAERALMNALITSLQVKIGELDPSTIQNRGFAAGEANLRILQIVAEAAGLSLETLRAGLADGSSLSQVIIANDGDVQSVKEALREAFSDLPGFQGQDVDQRIDELLNGSFALPAAPQQP